MRRGSWTLSGWLVAVLVVLVAAGQALSQATIPDGAFVRSDDGEWVIRNGQRHPILWTQDDGSLASLPTGAGVANLRELPGVSVASQATARTPGLGLRGDWRFQGNRSNSATARPQMGDLVRAGTIDERPATVDGRAWRVYEFARNGGFNTQRNVGEEVPAGVYSIVLLVRLDDVTNLRRLVDFKGGREGTGFFVRDGALSLYPVATGESAPVQAGVMHQIVITRDHETVMAYVDGVLQFTTPDPDGVGLFSNPVATFFRDSGSLSSAGAVARIRWYDIALTEQEIAQLDRLP